MRRKCVGDGMQRATEKRREAEFSITQAKRPACFQKKAPAFARALSHGLPVRYCCPGTRPVGTWTAHPPWWPRHCRS
ncbi:hypothetical protein CXK97_07600 [Stutzerimonas stutzeri]|nr:hypothetical protein CXK97_07600 [Stutzerimonas stutzeri]